MCQLVALVSVVDCIHSAGDLSLLAELLQEFPKLKYVAVFFSGGSIRKHAGQHHAYMREQCKMNREDRDEEVNDWI